MTGERAYPRGQRLRAERAQMARAARWLRVIAANQVDEPSKMYALAALFDALELQWVDVVDAVQQEALDACREVTGERQRAGRDSTKPGVDAAAK